jgi:transposase
MVAPYSIDLRKHIVQAYLAKEGTQAEIGKRSGVSPYAVGRLTRHFLATGSHEALPHSGGNPTQKLFEHHWQTIEGWLEAEPLQTWVQIAHRLQDQFQLTINPSQLSRILRRRGVSRKKQLATPR